MQSVGKNAPFGQVLNQVDSFTFENTRELGRKSLELVLQDQIEKAEKKRGKVEKRKRDRLHRGI